jgi:hypothetical protein
MTTTTDVKGRGESATRSRVCCGYQWHPFLYCRPHQKDLWPVGLWACGPVGLWACGACDLGVYRTVGAGANLGYPRARKQGERGIVTKKRAVCDERTIQRPIPITTPYRNHHHRQAQSSLKHTARFGLRQLIDWVSNDRSVSVEQFNSGFAD